MRYVPPHTPFRLTRTAVSSALFLCPQKWPAVFVSFWTPETIGVSKLSIGRWPCSEVSRFQERAVRCVVLGDGTWKTYIHVCPSPQGRDHNFWDSFRRMCPKRGRIVDDTQCHVTECDILLGGWCLQTEFWGAAIYCTCCAMHRIIICSCAINGFLR